MFSQLMHCSDLGIGLCQCLANAHVTIGRMETTLNDGDRRALDFCQFLVGRRERLAKARHATAIACSTALRNCVAMYVAKSRDYLASEGNTSLSLTIDCECRFGTCQMAAKPYTMPRM